MKLLIISDTHGEMPINVGKIDFDTVIHAGDIGNADFFGKFNSGINGKNLYAVYGNTDFLLSGYLPETVSTEIGGLNFFIVHNLTAPHRILPANESAISTSHAEIVVSGHTHTPLVEERNGIVFINPGSLGKVGLTGLRTFALAEISENRDICTEIYDIDAKETIVTKRFNKIGNLFKEI